MPECPTCKGRQVVPEFEGPPGFPSKEVVPCPDCSGKDKLVDIIADQKAQLDAYRTQHTRLGQIEERCMMALRGMGVIEREPLERLVRRWEAAVHRMRLEEADTLAVCVRELREMLDE